MLNPVAIVTGGSRGIGRGIARSLGEIGATVYVTGRSQRAAPSSENLPGTIDDTAEEVTARGGRGIAVRCDHTVDKDVESLFDRVRAEHGGLDLLVNNAWAGYENEPRGLPPGALFEQPLERNWQLMFHAGLRAQFAAARLAMPLLIGRKQGLVIHTVAWAFDEYLGNIFYDVAKAASIRMVFGLAHELRSHNVAAIALAPGFNRSERVMLAHQQHPFDLSGTESPEYTGRAVVALLRDSNRMDKSGRVYTVGELAREYGFTDVDGSQPVPFRMPSR